MPISLIPLAPRTIPSTAAVASAAFSTEPVVAHLCPHRHEFWDDFVASYARRITGRFYSEGWVFMVAVERGEDGSEEEVVGYAAWERRGASKAAERWRACVGGGDLDDEKYRGGSWGWRAWCALQRTISNTLHNLTTDRSLAQENLDAFEAVMSDNFPEAEYPELLYLGTLAVHPDHQRRGIGSMLVSWGVKHARREGVPVGTEASALGEGLYRKYGFEVVKKVVWDEGKGEEGRTPVMVWEAGKN